ncbi:hypothetical protein E2C01_038899 [Portunus trituberculatus]|uniref:Uncharacterized protein n=1 Tax=Portunus trituberculatus TaxID=210409 RepID=A0A5B7FI48_PORTR|nr:hypothetical protein [Portunus trituberculatus]
MLAWATAGLGDWDKLTIIPVHCPLQLVVVVSIVQHSRPREHIWTRREEVSVEGRDAGSFPSFLPCPFV